jgi:phage tail-like protein
MTTDKLRSYHFSTEAHWEACLVVGADRDPRRPSGQLRPLAPYARPATLHPSPGAHAPVVTRGGEILWRDDAGLLYRLSGDDDTPLVSPAQSGLRHARRVVAAPSGLWVVGKPADALQRYDEDTLARLLAADVPMADVVDIAFDGHDSILALLERKVAEGSSPQRPCQCARIDRAGHVVDVVELKEVSQPKALVYLRRSRRIVLLAGESCPRLYWFSVQGGAPLFRLSLETVRPWFEAKVLGSDSRERLLIAGVDNGKCGGGAHLLVLDADGGPSGEVPLDPLDGSISGIAATSDGLIVTGARGLLRLAPAEAIPQGAEHVTCTLVTPVLQSPNREDGRRWLRVEASADLPEGTTLEISIAATDDPVLRQRLKARAADHALPARARTRDLLNDAELTWRERTVFHGGDARSQQASVPLAAKLFDVREQYLWVSVAMTAAAGARLPVLRKLEVLYPGRTLMESLPGIYQRSEAEPHSFIRDLVGVLEATTQGLDASIGSMGARIHPTTAPEPWLDFLARWLGVPWDDELALAQKRAILGRAADLTKGRGTRAGLEALLDCLMPGAPRRFRVTDATADFGFAILGGDACGGSRLPAMLGGRTRWSTELDSPAAVLGSMRLPCADQRDDGAWHLSGKVRVDVAASASERKAWAPWLRRLTTEMVPLTTRLELRWVTAHALRTDRLDGTLTLEGAPTPHLGTDAITGLARLPERGTRLSALGSAIGTRLR